MKTYALLLAGLCMSVSVIAQSDPFVGIWVYDAQKSPKPTITYSIKDLGGNRYALTGSTGETTEITADGVSIKAPSGEAVSFKKLDDHTWQMHRSESRTMLRTYSVSADDKTLTLDDVFTAPDGYKQELMTMYAGLRITSATGTPTCACFKTPIICSTLNRFFRIHSLLGFGRRLTFLLVQESQGKSV